MVESDRAKPVLVSNDIKGETIMKLTIKDEILAYRSELIALRREFHRFPEPGYKEFRTSKSVYDYLKSIGFDSVRNICKTGVVGTLSGNKNNGRSVMLRVTMDGVPVQERTGLEYASVNPGYMHCGGTDAQMAVALVVSKILSRHRDMFSGRYVAVFQPNGELGGARDMIEDGILEELHPDHCLSMHFTSMLDAGRIGLSSGVVTGSTRQFIIRLKGKSGSSYMPHISKDPILAAARIIDGLQILETRILDPFTTVRIMLGKINGGTARNITPKEVVLEGTIRVLNMDMEDLEHGIETELKEWTGNVCSLMGIDCEVEFLNEVKSIKNDTLTANALRTVAERTYPDLSCVLEHRTLMSDDFSEFSSRVPSVLSFFGITNEAKNCVYPNNHARFNLDEEILTNVSEFFFRSIIDLLNQKQL